MEQRQALSSDFATLKQAWQFTLAEPNFDLNGFAFKLEPLSERALVVPNNPATLVLDIEGTEVSIVVSIDQLEEFCSHLPSASQSLKHSVTGAAVLVEYAGLELWDALSARLGKMVVPQRLLAGNKIPGHLALPAQITSTSGHDFPVLFSCSDEAMIAQLLSNLEELDPKIRLMANAGTSPDLITGRVFGGLFDTPIDVLHGLRAGDKLTIANGDEGLEGFILFSDMSALPVIIHNGFVEVVDGDVAPIVLGEENLPIFSKLVPIPAPPNTRAGIHLGRCTLTMRQMRKAMLDGRFAVTMMEDAVLVCNGKSFGKGQLNNDGEGHVLAMTAVV